MTSRHAAAGRDRRMVEVTTPARLHLGMLSFGMPGVRSFGGLGLMIDRPGVILRMTAADRFVATGPLADRAEAFARGCAAAWGLADAACRIDVVQAPPGHAGLGSGTQMALAVAAGMRRLRHGPAGGGAAERAEAIRFAADEAVALARAVGRGRRSCVGVYGFGGGGLILEGGRLVPADHRPEDDAVRPFSPLLARVRLPDAWRCILFVLRGACGLHGEDEKRAFASLPPVPLDVTAELARIAVMELLPAAAEGRFEPFADAVRRYGLLAGRPFETIASNSPQAEAAARLLTRLGTLGVVGTAQSSWGPTVMACAASTTEAEAVLERFAGTELAPRYDTAVVRFDGRGAVLRDVPADG